jgi:hypothetical protein
MLQRRTDRNGFDGQRTGLFLSFPMYTVVAGVDDTVIDVAATAFLSEMK